VPVADLPEYVQEVRALRLEPTDTVVLSVDRVLTREEEVQTAELVESLFPRNKVLILGRGEELQVVREDESPAPAR
jgi:hypothetical protein